MRVKNFIAVVLSLLCGIFPISNAFLCSYATYEDYVFAGPQEDGSFVMPDGTVYTAEQITSADTKPTISVTQASYTMEEAEAMGGVVPVTISVYGADMKWCHSGIHLYYDTELTPVLNKFGIPESTKGEAIEYLSSETATEEGGIFTVTAGSADYGFDGDIITYYFQLPEGYAPGDKWNLDLRYVSGDLFVNNAKDEAGMLMQAYALSNMVDGYIEIEESSCTVMEEGVSYDGYISSGSYDWYEFTANIAGTHIFEATGSMDNKGYLYNEYTTTTSSSYITYDDDSGQDNNFKIDYDMEAGETVYLYVSGYSSSSSGYYSVSVNNLSNLVYSGTCGDNLDWVLKNGTLTISGTGDMTDWDYYSDVPWYNYRDYIKEVIIENGVTSIGDDAFCECYALTSITIPDSVISIGDWAFSECYALTSITIPDSVISIGDWAFSDCYTLSSITIPEGVTSINDYTFYCCHSLASVTIPNSITNIGDEAFFDCGALTSITIPDSVTSIGDYAFYGCSSLASITIPDSVTSLGYCAFSWCGALTAINVDAENEYYTSIDGVLFNKDTTTLIQYPAGKTDIEYTIPDNVTNIGEYAFSYCDELITVAIPDSVTSIGDRAFYYCYSLTSVEIGNSVTSIGNSAFCECYALTSITIPDSVTSIGDYAFYYCYSLTSVEIGNSVTSIGNSAFCECYALTSITIPDSVTSIGDYAFYYCETLKSITIGNSVTSIGYGTFASCDALTSITIENPDCEIYDDSYTISNGYDEDYYFNGTIYGYKNSFAHKYAKKYNITFVSIGEAELPEYTIIEEDGLYSGYLSEGAKDWYQFTATTSCSFIFETTGDTDVEGYLYYSDSPSAYGSDTYDDVDINVSLDNGETVYLKLQGSDETTSGDYSLRVTGYTRLYENTQYYLYEDSEDWYEFWTPTSGAYIIESNGDLDLLGSVYSTPSSNDIIASNDDGGTGNNFKLLVEDYNGYNLFLKVTGISDSTSGSYSLSTHPLCDLRENFNTYAYISGDSVDWYRFTAETAGTYTFESTSSIDNKAYLYSSIYDTTHIAYNDDGGEGSNFLISYDMEAGETVYLKITGYSSSTDGSYMVSVTKEATETVEPVEGLFANAYFIGYIGAENCWGIDDVNSLSYGAQINGNAQYEVKWDVTESGGTDNIQFLAIQINPAEGINNFTSIDFPDLAITLDEVWIDDVLIEDYTVSTNAIDTNYSDGGAGGCRIYLHDEWAGTGTADLPSDTTIVDNIRVKFTVSGLSSDGDSNVTEDPIEPSTETTTTTTTPTETTTTTTTPETTTLTETTTTHEPTTTTLTETTTTTTTPITTTTTTTTTIQQEPTQKIVQMKIGETIIFTDVTDIPNGTLNDDTDSTRPVLSLQNGNAKSLNSGTVTLLSDDKSIEYIIKVSSPTMVISGNDVIKNSSDKIVFKVDNISEDIFSSWNIQLRSTDNKFIETAGSPNNKYFNISNDELTITVSPKTSITNIPDKEYRLVLISPSASGNKKYEYDISFTIEPEVETPSYLLGDVDCDGAVNASDASMVLAEYAIIATGGTPTFSEEQTKAADVNADGATDAIDASSILGYYAFVATGGNGTIEEYLN